MRMSRLSFDVERADEIEPAYAREVKALLARRLRSASVAPRVSRVFDFDLSDVE